MNIKELFLFSDRVFCYGIGGWGRLITKYCKQYNLKIFAYVVSASHYKNTKFSDKEVLPLMGGVIKQNDGIIIATTNKKNQKEILINIKKMSNCNNIYFMENDEELCDFFWKKYLKQVKKRKHYHIFSYMALSQPIVPEPIGNWNIDNIYYGQANCVKKFLKMKRYNIKNCIIDHGARFIKQYKKNEIHPKDGNLFSMSDFVWREFPNIRVHSIGPFIIYAKSMLSRKKLEKIKCQMGKTLLVFPVHTGWKSSAQYKQKDFIEEIEKIKNIYKYNNVMICCFCIEILKGSYQAFRGMGYKIVTAGYPTDLNFLRRLKSFILLADTVITNSIGTHLGYSVALKRPTYIFDMDIKNIGTELVNREAGYIVSENEVKKGIDREREIKDAFGMYTESISDKQYSIIQKYWGYWK